MTHLILTQVNFLQNAISEVMAFIKGLVKSQQDYSDYRETYKTLNRMSDRELNDIGITRGDIAAVARGKDVRGGM